MFEKLFKPTPLPASTETAKEERSKILNWFKQELAGQIEKALTPTMRELSQVMSRLSWLTAQRWCTLTETGPTLLPNYTRMYYRKGNREVLVLELPPQTRHLTFQKESVADAPKKRYSLGLPFMIFILRFDNGKLDSKSVKVGFSDRPLKTLKDQASKPHLPNIGGDLTVCMGTTFPTNELEVGNIGQQAAFAVSYFFNSNFNDHMPGAMAESNSYFKDEPRLHTFEAWEKATLEDPLFVIDIEWPKHSESVGDMVSHLFDGENEDQKLSEKIYAKFTEEVVPTILSNVKASVDEALKDEYWTEKKEEKPVEKKAEVASGT